MTTVIALVGERSITDARRGPRSNPAVVSSRQLVEWLARQRPAHLVAELGLIRLAAEEPSTWHVDSTAADTLRIMQRFDRLMEEVGAAPKPVRAPAGAAPASPYGRGVSSSGARTPSRRAPAERSERHARAPRRRTKAEIRRQERRQEDLIKLVLLLGAGLTAPLWAPGAIALFTSVLTNAVTPGP